MILPFTDKLSQLVPHWSVLTLVLLGPDNLSRASDRSGRTVPCYQAESIAGWGCVCLSPEGPQNDLRVCTIHSFQKSDWSGILTVRKFLGINIDFQFVIASSSSASVPRSPISSCSVQRRPCLVILRKPLSDSAAPDLCQLAPCVRVFVCRYLSSPGQLCIAPAAAARLRSLPASLSAFRTDAGRYEGYHLRFPIFDIS